MLYFEILFIISIRNKLFRQQESEKIKTGIFEKTNIITRSKTRVNTIIRELFRIKDFN